MCVSNPNYPGADGKNLVLRSCNQQVWQAFMAEEPEEKTSVKPAAPQATTYVLPKAPTSSDTIYNASSTTHTALYSVVNGRFVEGPRPRMSGVAVNPGPPVKALSATGRSGETVTSSNTWFWTNAAGK